MPHVIDASLCTSCGLCAQVCPTDAISEGAESYAIDADLCTDCDLCTSECPSEAICEE